MLIREEFKKLAQQATTLSPIMEGRTKIETEDIIKYYPDGITIVAFDFVTVEDKTYPVCAFREDDRKFLNGGTVLMKILSAWVAAYDGDIEECSADLCNEGGVKVKFSAGKTKKGQNITLVEIL